MTVSIGPPAAQMGPRSAMESFGERTDGPALDRRVVARLLKYLRPHWRRMGAALLLMLVSTALTLATPYLIKVAIDRFIARGDAQTAFNPR